MTMEPPAATPAATPPAIDEGARAALSFAADLRVTLRRAFRDRRFWVIQVMMAGVTAGHASWEAFEVLSGGDLEATYFIPASLYFIPVLYAGLNFGRAGAIPTAVASCLLAIPNIIVWHGGLEAAGESFQMLLMVVLAILIAARVDREVVARGQAERQEKARRASELRYRALFDGAAEPILVFDARGVIREANAAAGALLGRAAGDLQGVRLVDVLGRSGAATLMRPARRRPGRTTDLAVRAADGREVWVEPVCTYVPGEGEATLIQALLLDATERRGLQTYAQEIVRAQEEERQRIAQELHDVSLQSVALLCRRLDDIEAEAAKRLSESAVRLLTQTRLEAEAMGDTLRRFSRDLRPAILDDLGLVPAVKRLLSESSGRSPLRGRLTVTGAPRRLPSDVELSLFRIAQEALHNVEGHAAASRVAVRLDYQPEAVRLTVTDDGKGFGVPAPASELTGGDRLGLLGMRERARSVGGTCEIHSQPGKGTRIEAWVPAASRS